MAIKKNRDTKLPVSNITLAYLSYSVAYKSATDTNNREVNNNKTVLYVLNDQSLSEIVASYFLYFSRFFSLNNRISKI